MAGRRDEGIYTGENFFPVDDIIEKIGRQYVCVRADDDDARGFVFFWGECSFLCFAVCTSVSGVCFIKIFDFQ